MELITLIDRMSIDERDKKIFKDIFEKLAATLKEQNERIKMLEVSLPEVFQDLGDGIDNLNERIEKLEMRLDILPALPERPEPKLSKIDFSTEEGWENYKKFYAEIEKVRRVRREKPQKISGDTQKIDLAKTVRPAFDPTKDDLYEKADETLKKIHAQPAEWPDRMYIGDIFFIESNTKFKSQQITLGMTSRSSSFELGIGDARSLRDWFDDYISVYESQEAAHAAESEGDDE